MSKPDEGIPSSTYVIDPEQAAELARLMQQERVVTEGMGGLFPEGQELPEDGRVLDLACGPGGWALELAFAYPQLSVNGVDISASIIEYARAQAQSCRLENVHFRTMNIMQLLAFPDGFFDLINARFIAWFMTPAAWPRLLAECRRLLKPGGIIRLTEGEPPLTTSAAFEALMDLATRALQRAGQSFSPDGRHVGITPMLPRLLRQAGFEEVRLRASAIEWSSGTPAHDGFFKDFLIAFEIGRPFSVKLGLATLEELERLSQQAVAEMQQDEFCAVSLLLTVWGRQPATAPASTSEQEGQPG